MGGGGGVTSWGFLVIKRELFFEPNHITGNTITVLYRVPIYTIFNGLLLQTSNIKLNQIK